MMFCTHFRSEMAVWSKTPLAVPFAWFLFGLLLFSTFESWIIALIGIFIFSFNGIKLAKRLQAMACCMRNRKRIMERGQKDPGVCWMKSEA